MQKFSIPLLSFLCLMVALTFVVSACKDDDEPPVKPKLSFAEATRTVNEADGVIEIEVVLDKPASQDITIEYSLSGTAVDNAIATQQKSPDYEVLSKAGEVDIDKGETKGIIEIELYSDNDIEEDETLEISIDAVSDENIELTREDEIVLTIKQEDGLVIGLAWPNPTADSVADMDILVRVGESISNLKVFSGSATSSYQSPEFVFIPKAINATAFGMSYIYYEGTVNNLSFAVSFIDFVNGEVEPESGVQVFEGSYTQANKNEWTDATINSTIVVQTFTKTDGNFTNISEITRPTSGSRTGHAEGIVSSLKALSEYKNVIQSERIRALVRQLNK